MSPTSEPDACPSHTEAARTSEPTEHYGAMRESCPVHHETSHDPPFFVLSRFDDVVDALKNPETWGSRNGPGVFFQDDGVLGTTDDPEHSRHRRVLRPAFVKSAVSGLGPEIREITDGLIDEFIDDGHCDFVPAFATPLPALAIGALLGIEPAKRHEFGQWSEDAVAALTGGDVERYDAAKRALGDAIELGVNTRDERLRAGSVSPAEEAELLGTELPDDVLSRLAIARRNQTLSLEEMRYVGYQLLVAGHETTTSLLGLMLNRLLERPELFEQLKDNPNLIPAAVEEALRFDSPVHGLFRTNAEPVTVHDTVIPAGTKLQLSFAAANRDPAQFPEPDEFKIDREQREIGRHVAFGWGIHHCLGAHLARLEVTIAFEQILSRLKNLRLDGQPQRNDSFILHGLTSLPLRFDPPTPQD